MLSRLIPKLHYLALLAGCMTILQTHNVEFWSKFIDEQTGWLCSFTLEGLALTLWASKSRKRQLFGGLVTTILLCGPLYQVSEKLVLEWQGDKTGAVANAARLAALAEDIPALQKELDTYLANARIRKSLPKDADAETKARIEAEAARNREMWGQRADAARVSLEKARTEREQVTRAVAEAKPLDIQRVLILVLQGAAFIAFQFGGVLAITELRGVFNVATVETPEEAPAHAPSAKKTGAAASHGSTVVRLLKPLRGSQDGPPRPLFKLIRIRLNDLLRRVSHGQQTRKARDAHSAPERLRATS